MVDVILITLYIISVVLSWLTTWFAIHKDIARIDDAKLKDYGDVLFLIVIGLIPFLNLVETLVFWYTVIKSKVTFNPFDPLKKFLNTPIRK